MNNMEYYLIGKFDDKKFITKDPNSMFGENYDMEYLKNTARSILDAVFAGDLFTRIAIDFVITDGSSGVGAALESYVYIFDTFNDALNMIQKLGNNKNVIGTVYEIDATGYKDILTKNRDGEWFFVSYNAKQPWNLFSFVHFGDTTVFVAKRIGTDNTVVSNKADEIIYPYVDGCEAVKKDGGASEWFHCPHCGNVQYRVGEKVTGPFRAKCWKCGKPISWQSYGLTKYTVPFSTWADGIETVRKGLSEAAYGGYDDEDDDDE